LNMPNKIITKTKNLIFGDRRKIVWGVPNPRHSDIYLVSYPKSGNTWMRYLMAYAIWPELTDVDLVEMAAYIPSFRLIHDSAMMQDPDAPCNQLKHRLIKEHTAYNKLAKHHVKRAIYIVRDGRDAIVSYWYFCNQRDNTSISFSDFIKLSAKPSHSYGPWKDHVKGWMNASLDAKLIIRYEDLLDNTHLWLSRALKFAEIDVPDAVIETAINRASFNSMKKLERTKGFNLDQLKNVDFVRQGKSGSWINVFGKGDLERFNRFHGGAVATLCYSW